MRCFCFLGVIEHGVILCAGPLRDFLQVLLREAEGVWER
jgi:hypothetical protein